MYRTKWREENGHWRCIVQRQIGPHIFEVSEVIETELAEVDACSRLEARCLFALRKEITLKGGII